MEGMLIMNGIYQYRDLKTDEIVYIGKDSNIDKNRRYREHLYPSRYNAQVFNRVLQNNPDRYEYEIVYAGDFSDDMLDTLEINTIAEFKLMNNGKRPKFNFTDGGQGNKYWLGKKRSDETRKKLREANIGKKHSEETKRKIKERNSGENHYNYGKKHSFETREKMSKNHYDCSCEKNPSWKDYPRIIKAGIKPTGKQNYMIRYKGKNIKQSVYYNKLVKWFKENYPNEELRT